jgi:hypothetical protein
MNESKNPGDASISRTLQRLTEGQSSMAGALEAAGFHSVFGIATTPMDEFLHAPSLAGVANAQRLYRGAVATTVAIARAFREQRLTAFVRHAVGNRSGIRSLVDGPCYEDQFEPSWSRNCLPDSLEATTGPIAYLVDLYRKARTLEGEGVANLIIALSVRRPDLDAMLLDQASVYQVKPTIVVVNRILESAIEHALADQELVDDALLAARYPFVLPYERYQHQINYVLGRKKYALGDVVRLADLDYPYFVRDGLHAPMSDIALLLDTTLGPVQQELLLEDPHAADAQVRRERVNPRTLLRSDTMVSDAVFLKRFYGVDTLAELIPVTEFCRRTAMKKEQLESLLSIERCWPVISPNAPNAPGAADLTPAQFGSIFINTDERLYISVQTDSNGELHTLQNLTVNALDRIQRLVRLSRWLDLPFDQADQILCAAMRVDPSVSPAHFWPNENTLRALGLFRRLRRDFGISAEDFAALLEGPSVYARGAAVSHFDRIFNSQDLFAEPLVLDDSPFPIVPKTDTQYRKIDHLCSALGITFETYLYLARFIFQSSEAAAAVARGDGNDKEEKLSWSLEVVGAFYRLARLPRYLGVSAIEAVALLQVVNHRGVQFVERLANPSLFTAQHSSLADTVTVIQALTDVVAWCRKHELTVLWLHQQLIPVASMGAATDREIGLLTQINGRMRATLISDGTFVDAALPTFSNVDPPAKIDWMAELGTFVAANGLIREVSGIALPAEYEASLTQFVNALLQRLEHSDSAIQTKLVSIVLDAKAAQEALVWESLGSTFDCSAEQSRELLRWSGGNCYTLLEEVLRVFASSGHVSALPVPVGDQILATLARLGVRAAIARQLAISAYALRSYVEHPGWFVPGGNTETEDVSFVLLHALVQYQTIVKVARQGEQPVLDYLRLVNQLPEGLTPESWVMIREDAASKIAVFTGFGIREVLETTLHISESGIVTTVEQLDQLVRLRQLCDDLQLGTQAVLDLGALSPLSPIAEFRAAAEGALSALTSAAPNWQISKEGEMGQSEGSWIAADKEVIVARTNERVQFTLTVRDFLGQPARNINVRWIASLGRLGSPSAETTDENGQVSISLEAGDVMGSAQVMAVFGLDRQIMAPMVQIDCEEATLDFQVLDGTPSTEEALAGNLETIEFGVMLVDDYDNPGRDRVIQWSSDLAGSSFVRPQTRTDEDGKAYASLRSFSAGEARVKVEYPVNGNEHTFTTAVEFVDRPWFRYVRPAGPLVEGEPMDVSCQLLKLDGTPEAGVEVTFSVEPAGSGTFEPVKQVTDGEGIARTTYTHTATVPGSVALKCGTEAGAQASSGILPVYEKTRIVAWSPAGDIVHAIGQSEPTRFSVTLAPVEQGLSVEWWMGEKLLQTTYTNSVGMAKFERHFRQPDFGNRVIEARTTSAGVTHEFEVNVVNAHDRISLESETPDTAFRSSDSVYVDRGYASVLKLRAHRSVGGEEVGDGHAVFHVSLQPGAVDPSLFGITFDPPLDTPLNASEEGYAALTIDCTNAYFPDDALQGNVIKLNIVTNVGVELPVEVCPRDFLASYQPNLWWDRDRNMLALSAIWGELRLMNSARKINPPMASYVISINQIGFEGAASNQYPISLFFSEDVDGNRLAYFGEEVRGDYGGPNLVSVYIRYDDPRFCVADTVALGFPMTLGTWRP